ncbi:MAG TPA: sugar nucleotide-binding protein [Bacteriovoracaceae bacterium]|nr:sugar nucleotide-binding protein [Bacteriovoracaceae bacterium]
MKKTILIFGVSSFVGANLAEALRNEYRIIGTYHTTPVEIPGVSCVPCDVLKRDVVTYLLTLFRPDFTIYSVGLSSLKECQLYPRLAESLNTLGAINCSTASERVGCRFIQLSSAFVLGGEKTMYKEGDSPFPLTNLGHTLTSTEFQIQRSNFNYLILRCSSLYGRSFNHTHLNWFEVLQAALARKEPVFADDTVSYGFLDVQLLAGILKSALESGVVNRLFHVSTKNVMTRFEFARAYARVFKKDAGLVQKITGAFPIDHSRNLKESDSTNLSYHLDTSNLESFLNIELPSIEESLGYTLKRFQNLSSGKSSSQTP